MKPSKGNRAIGYIRVSDRDQVQGHSLVAQESGIRRWCERNGYELVRIFAEEGESAHVDEIQNRPEFKLMLDVVGWDKPNIVVVHTLDRWARKLSIQGEAFRILANVGVGFSSVMENTDMFTPSGRLMLNTMGSINEFFSDQWDYMCEKPSRYELSRDCISNRSHLGTIRWIPAVWRK